MSDQPSIADRNIKVVPKHIVAKMHQLAKLADSVCILSHVVSTWFEENGCDPEKMRSNSGTSFEELEYGNDVTDDFIEDYYDGKFFINESEGSS